MLIRLPMFLFTDNQRHSDADISIVSFTDQDVPIFLISFTSSHHSISNINSCLLDCDLILDFACNYFCYVCADHFYSLMREIWWAYYCVSTHFLSAMSLSCVELRVFNLGYLYASFILHANFPFCAHSLSFTFHHLPCSLIFSLHNLAMALQFLPLCEPKLDENWAQAWLQNIKLHDYYSLPICQ